MTTRRWTAYARLGGEGGAILVLPVPGRYKYPAAARAHARDQLYQDFKDRAELLYVLEDRLA